ncbi:zinc finger protein 397-like isoform X1 [Cydia splendana]|uniref:zinc finger protein 397-like isoform X1 n=1 Tax=Cydia splendana TaxID=1100963 RepID=UPI00300D6123
MGDLLLKCPLCCSEVFNSRELLVHHLSKVWLNLHCPVCNDECSSISHMIDHLNQNNCVPKPKSEAVISNPIVPAAIHNIAEETPTLEHHNVAENQASQMLNQTQDVSDVSRMYVELLSKQLAKPCLQTQELKLVKEDGESRYVIVTQEESVLKSGSTVFTKQNSDGTISLTTVKDMKLETDPVDPLMPENEPEETQEIYSCNTCGVSFSSVIEHIQNYHNDQEVVVEESLDSCQLPIDYEPMNGEDVTTGELQQSRRVITDTGDIVEAPVLLNATLEDNNLTIEPLNTDLLVERKSKPPRPVAVVEKKLVQVDSVVTNLKNKEDVKKGPYHKVVVKEMQMLEGGNKVKVYNCMTCNIYVTSLDEFKSQPCKPQKFQCPHCSVAYENSKSLSAHMKIHKAHTEDADSTGPFKCDICSTVFPSNKSLKLHKRMHDPVKARPIELPVESEGTETSNDKYICSICDKLIPIDYRAVHHNSHNTDNKYNCDICNRKFHSSEYLEMHMSVHNLDKVQVNKQDKSLPYNCMYCTRQFARPHEKVKHERIHTGEKPHSCEICGKSFRVSYCLTLHMRTHTGARPYACPHCNKRFKAHSVYNHHLLTHSEVRAYKCPYCPKAFKTSVQLAGHKNSHTKPFSCTHCNRPFASLYAVRAHTETHARQNNLKFACTLCGASYARTFALKDHIKQVHNQELDAINKTTVDLKEEGWILPEADAEMQVVSLDKTVPNEINQLVEAESVMIYGSHK